MIHQRRRDCTYGIGLECGYEHHEAKRSDEEGGETQDVFHNRLLCIFHFKAGLAHQPADLFSLGEQLDFGDRFWSRTPVRRIGISQLRERRSENLRQQRTSHWVSRTRFGMRRRIDSSQGPKLRTFLC
jgi:hypothetical protein